MDYYCEACDRMSDKIVDLRDALDEANMELSALRAFAQDILAGWPHGGIDGGDLQTIAVRYGLLEAVTMSRPCGEYCDCALSADFPTVCYRKTWLLNGCGD